MPSTHPVPALPAATVTFVRDGREGLEVLMLRRNLQSSFMPGVFLFPGGAVDAEDRSPSIVDRCSGLTDADASEALGVPKGGLVYWIAALREAYEEAGLLLAHEAETVLSSPSAAARLGEYRRRLNAGEAVFGEMLEREDLTLAADRLTYFSHWITPVNAPRRYDTRFFVAAAPPEQEPEPDFVETIGYAWVRPAEAVERYHAGDLKMRTPTIRTMEKFAAFNTAASLITALRSAPPVKPILARIRATGESVLPGEVGYEEAGEAPGPWKR